MLTTEPAVFTLIRRLCDEAEHTLDTPQGTYTVHTPDLLHAIDALQQRCAQLEARRCCQHCGQHHVADVHTCSPVTHAQLDRACTAYMDALASDPEGDRLVQATGDQWPPLVLCDEQWILAALLAGRHD